MKDLGVKIFADGADLAGMNALCADPLIAGLTTNPTLMRQAGVVDYPAFARSVLAVAGSRPVSFEVLSDDFDEMERQALTLASWGPNVYVKIPITNTRAESSAKLVASLSRPGREGQRDGDPDLEPRSPPPSRRCATVPAATSRCSQAASPTPAAIPSQSMQTAVEAVRTHPRSS